MKKINWKKVVVEICKFVIGFGTGAFASGCTIDSVIRFDKVL